MNPVEPLRNKIMRSPYLKIELKKGLWRASEIAPHSFSEPERVLDHFELQGADDPNFREVEVYARHPVMQIVHSAHLLLGKKPILSIKFNDRGIVRQLSFDFDHSDNKRIRELTKTSTPLVEVDIPNSLHKIGLTTRQVWAVAHELLSHLKAEDLTHTTQEPNGIENVNSVKSDLRKTQFNKCMKNMAQAAKFHGASLTPNPEVR